MCVKIGKVMEKDRPGVTFDQQHRTENRNQDPQLIALYNTLTT